MDIGRQISVGFTNQPGDNLATVAAGDLTAIARHHGDGEKGDYHTDQHPLGQPEDEAKLMIESPQVHCVDRR